jgi:hypothetical protein
VNEILKEMTFELEKLSRAVLELQAIAQHKDAKLTLEVSADALHSNFDTLRKQIDALPKA